ncbi:uncharacterized protein BYT42DRAFT_166491 [Radiomyces spectabilis]|uniref:uncharacterized protein n=1 Tax=Radiomyces spectabilis TaxID=64574 RepID=UPI0022209715|nr:uncharacterized protein BYT42DRAFT_166491 [Radiomyces spectabilis]KAI8364717.1 hypothetical protein BYT42DRAFT_166491 [Radiomyces spectabilis]
MSTAAVAPQSRAAPSISSSSYRSNDTPFSVESQKPASTASDPSRRNQHDEQQEQLTEARQTIEQLRKQLDAVRQEPPTSVRPRLQYSASGRKLAPTVQPLDAVHQHLAQLERPRPTEGYPVQVVIAIAVIVFVFTYIFF